MAVGLTLGLGSLIGGLAGAGTSVFGANKSADQSADNTAKQIDWEKERAQNAHQWEVSDLEKAGLNPILSAGGSGAVTGSISPSLPDNTGYGKAGEFIERMLANVLNAQQVQANTAKTMAETKKTQSETDLTDLLQITERYKHGLIDRETYLKEIESKIANEKLSQEEINTAWKETEKWVDNSTKIAGAVTKIIEDIGLYKLLKGKGKGIQKPTGKSNWVPYGNNGAKLNTKTGEIREGGSRYNAIY